MKKRRIIGIWAFLLSGIIFMNSCLSATVSASTVSGGDAVVTVSGNDMETTVSGNNPESTVSGMDSETTMSNSHVAKEEIIELTQEFKDTIVTMFGPADSFPYAEELSISVSEIDEKTAETVETAIMDEAEKLGKEVKSYQAFDIKLMADGREVQPLGPVYVTFTKEVVENLLAAEPITLELNEDTITESTTAEEIAEKIEVFHVDETTGAVQNMEAEITEAGEVVMETDHFSVYVAVNLGAVVNGKVTLKVKHYAYLTYIDEDAVADASVMGNAVAGYPKVFQNAKDEVYNMSTQSINNQTGYREIYSEDSIELPNGFSGTLENLSKVYLADKSNKHYTIEGYYRLKSDGTYEKLTDGKTYEFTVNNSTETVVINYTPVSSRNSYSQPTLFFDYNITDGYLYNKQSTNAKKNKVSQTNNGTQQEIKYFNAQMQGINSLVEDGANSSINSNKAVYTIGNWANGVVTEGFTNTSSKKAYEKYGYNKYYHITKAEMDAGVGLNGTVGPFNQQGYLGTLAKSLPNGKSYNVYNTINRISQVKVTTNGNTIYPYLTVAEGILTGLSGTNYSEVNVNDGVFMIDNLFNSTNITGSDANGTTYYKKVYNDFNLVFDQYGETYTLNQVTRNGYQTPVSDNLSKISKYTDFCYSNGFWPLDSLEYYNGKDPLFGSYRGVKTNPADNENYEYSNLGAIGKDDNDPIKVNDDWYKDSSDRTSHNWFFGMRYDFDFTIGDYTGPMNFYFRGDDDFWLFVDGKLAIDMGGIHIAQGENLNIREWINQTYANDPEKRDVNYPHRISIIYTERGGYGSCCYMQFTIPNVTPVKVDTSVEYTTVTAQKQWDDAIDGYSSYSERPESVTVQLYQGEDVYSLPVTLNAANEWKYTWSNLIKKNPVTGAVYDYTVKEIVSRDDYVPSYKEEGSTITITNTLKRTSVTASKSWDDKVWNSQDYAGRPINVVAVLYQNEEPYREIELNASNGWTYTWENLPLCNASGKNYTYRVDEKLVPDGYEKTIDGFTIQNTLKKTSFTVSKEWMNETGVSDSRPEKVWIRLEQKIGSNSWNRVANASTNLPDVELNASNGWSYTFTDLPKYDTTSGIEIQYRVREVTGKDGVVIEDNGCVEGKSGWNYQVSYPDNETITNTLQKTSLTLTKRIDQMDEENATAIFRYLITDPNDYKADVTVNFETGTIKLNGTTVSKDSDGDINNINNNIGFDKAGLSVTIQNLQPGTYFVMEYAARGYELVKMSTEDGTPSNDAQAINGVQNPISTEATVDAPGTVYYWNRYKVPTDYTAVNRFSVDSLGGKVSISVKKKSD